MSVENVKKFYEVLSQDKEMQQKFIDLNQKHQGQPMDEAKGMSIFEQEALPLAAQMGYSFTIDDVKSYELAMQQAKNGCEMSDAEMEAVTGGFFLCVLIGAGDQGGFCVAFGFDSQFQQCFLWGCTAK